MSAASRKPGAARRLWTSVVHRGRLLRVSPSVTAIFVLGAGVLFVAGIAYYGAKQFTGQAAETRATSESRSIAQHSARLATADVFGGYIQILRYADEPVLNDRSAVDEDRLATMRMLLELNDNKFTSLSIADLSGRVVASSEPAIRNVRDSQPFMYTRSTAAPANSDVVMETPGERGYIELTAALRDVEGQPWGVLVGRADPARLWRETLFVSIDTSRNVIVNTQGQYAAGVPEELLGTAWRGRPLGDGSVLATITGIESLCALTPIGRDTRIDQGLNVASCLPMSVIAAEHDNAMGNLEVVILAAAVLAIVLGAGVLRALVHDRPSAPAGSSAGERKTATTASIPDQESVIEPEDRAVEEVGPDEDNEQNDEEPRTEHGAPTADEEPPPVLAPDVNAVALIDAYESRNARLAERLRESVQARLLVAATRADEAYRTKSSDPATATPMHSDAMEELAEVRDRELRSIGQELHPALVRLGLPAALRGLKKDLAGAIEITLEIDADADAVSETAGRVAVPQALRLALYRIALESARTLGEAGAGECEIALRRTGGWITLTIRGAGVRRDDFKEDLLRAGRIGLEAYGGALRVVETAEGLSVIARLPGTVRGEAGSDDSAEAAGEERPAGVIGLVAELEMIRAASGGMSVDLRAEPGERASRLDDDTAGVLAEVARVTVDTLRLSNIEACSVVLEQSDERLLLEVSCQALEAADLTSLEGRKEILAPFEGTLDIVHEDGRLAVTAAVPLPHGDDLSQADAADDAA